MKQISVSLPTKGLLYPQTKKNEKGEDVPNKLCGLNQLNIRELTATEEDILASKDLVKSGKFMDELIKSSLIDKDLIKDLDLMFIGDRNALIYAIRVISLGKDYDVNITCGKCAKESAESFDLSNTQTTGVTSEEDDVIPNIFEFTFPECGKKIAYKFLNVKEENEITQSNIQYKKIYKSKNDHLITLRLKKMILSIDGSDKNINVFCDQLSMKDSKAFRKEIKIKIPNITLNHIFTCADCGHEEVIDLPPMDANFFWPE